MDLDKLLLPSSVSSWRLRLGGCCGDHGLELELEMIMERSYGDM